MTFDNSNGELKIFNLWKNTQIDIIESKNNLLQDKKNILPFYKNQFEEIMKDVKYIDINIYEFNLNHLVKIIKYINNSNSFFNNRIGNEFIYEISLIASIYELSFLKIDNEKNTNIQKETAIEKLKISTLKTNSEYLKLFENVDIKSYLGLSLFIVRIKEAIHKIYNSLITMISRDAINYSKIEKEQIIDTSSIKDEYFVNLWRNTFILEDERVTYSYNIVNSDETFIFINVETQHEQVAFVKFKMFETFSLKNGVISASGISKEIMRIEFLNQKYENIGSSILANSLKLANRVIKNIFLPQIKINK